MKSRRVLRVFVLHLPAGIRTALVEGQEIIRGMFLEGLVRSKTHVKNTLSCLHSRNGIFEF